MRKQAKICILLNSLLCLILKWENTCAFRVDVSFANVPGLVQEFQFQWRSAGKKTTISCKQRQLPAASPARRYLGTSWNSRQCPIQNQWPATDCKKWKTETRKPHPIKWKKKNHGEKKWVPALRPVLVPMSLVPKVTSNINIFIYTSDPFPFCYPVHVSI